MQFYKKQEFKKNTAMYGRGSFTEEEKEEHTILSNSNILYLNLHSRSPARHST